MCVYLLWALFFNSLARTLFCKSSSFPLGSYWRPSSLSSSGALTISQKNKETSNPSGFVRCIRSMTTPEEKIGIQSIAKHMLHNVPHSPYLVTFSSNDSTCFFKVISLGTCLSVFRTVSSVRIVPASKDHEALVGQSQLDVTVKVGAAPQSISKGSLPTTHDLCGQLSSFFTPKLINILNTLSSWKDKYWVRRIYPQKNHNLKDLWFMQTGKEGLKMHTNLKSRKHCQCLMKS